ncbi:hypothetical protein CARUB_v10007245mg [Capsella rubella]|uniref:RRM domain-containing protein n=1 Tax=Capsella rubella TaxID=81985 RepID=R0GP68_9BRAS|nr:hypothetical protein CARUB_v10007245mg [Capsella rubella]
MASSSKESAAKADLFGKRANEDSNLENIQILKKQKETYEEKMTYSGDQLLDEATFCLYAISILVSLGSKCIFGGISVASVRLIVNNEGKHLGYAFVEFASPFGAHKALKEKNGAYLYDHKIYLMSGHDHETPDYVEAVAAQRKTIFVSNLSPQTEISHIINFFKDVGEVVHVRLIVDKKGMHVGSGFVEFSSDNEAEKVRVVYNSNDAK